MRLFITTLLAALALPAWNSRADGIGNDAQPVYEMCATCHGLDGLSHMSKFPKLAGQNPDYIVKQLEDFLHGRRTNDEGQMETVATEITDTQRLEVARYFSELPAPPRSMPADGDSARGQELFEKRTIVSGVPACAACHDLSAAKNHEQAIPHLRGQHRDYTIKQLRDFKSGSRANDPSGIMRSIARQLSDSDIETVASFLETSGSNP